uniref:Solute carrier family 40 member n=1 Tax=Phaeomonas parva TaxID=124430 RepID=A0A7S1XZ85_9STRA|mmetsp:Transcript_8604/g.24905  ORF Transcript_8604/g.24905 Transcript_8604/m.24905 type:complete len:255 (+) Transcript_8604:177-941(+)
MVKMKVPRLPSFRKGKKNKKLKKGESTDVEAPQLAPQGTNTPPKFQNEIETYLELFEKRKNSPAQRRSPSPLPSHVTESTPLLPELKSAPLDDEEELKEYDPKMDLFGAAPPRGTAWKLLLSHGLTKFGARAWEFATPLLLLQWSPGSLAAPACFGLAVMLSKFFLSPSLGARADTWNRMTAVTLGAILQALGCGLALGALAVKQIDHGSDLIPPGLLKPEAGGRLIGSRALCEEALGSGWGWGWDGGSPQAYA